MIYFYKIAAEGLVNIANSYNPLLLVIITIVSGLLTYIYNKKYNKTIQGSKSYENYSTIVCISLLSYLFHTLLIIINLFTIL